MTLPRLILDSGNHRVKAVCGASKIDFLHLLAPLTKAQYDRAMESDSKRKKDYLAVALADGVQYFAVGDSASSYRVTRREGAPRYEPDYYGVLFAAVVARFSDTLGARNTKGQLTELRREGLHVIASHASRDHRFAGRLKAAMSGDWRFRCGEEDFEFSVEVDDTYEEPFGGYAKRAFVRNDHGRWTTPLTGQRVGIIDIGGGTVGVLAVNDGEVDYGSADSAGQGVNLAVDRLKDTLKSEFPDFFGQASDIPMSVLQEAIRTGDYRGGGRKWSVREAVDESLFPLLNEVRTLWQTRLNSGLALDFVLLTGGGSVLLGEEVQKAIGFPPESVIYATSSLDQMQFANVEGAKSYFDLLEAI